MDVPVDYAEAIRWYRRAAEQGNASAQVHLAVMYARGRGVPVDHAEAARWYRRAADQGDAFAARELGGMYANGRGVPRDDAEAIRLYEQLLSAYPNSQDAIAALSQIEARQRQEETRQWQAELSAQPGNRDRSDAPVLGADQTWIDPSTGAPCVTVKAQGVEDARFWDVHYLILGNRCNLAFPIRAGVDRWDGNSLYQEQRRIIHRRRSGNDLTELRLTCWQSRRFEIGCRGFTGWSVTGVAEGW